MMGILLILRNVLTLLTQFFTEGEEVGWVGFGVGLLDELGHYFDGVITGDDEALHVPGIGGEGFLGNQMNGQIRA